MDKGIFYPLSFTARVVRLLIRLISDPLCFTLRVDWLPIGLVITGLEGGGDFPRSRRSIESLLSLASSRMDLGIRPRGEVFQSPGDPRSKSSTLVTYPDS